MRKTDELDDLIRELERGKIKRRTFVQQALLMGLSFSSLGAFLSSKNASAKDAFAQSKPAGKPVELKVGYFPSWVGGWSSSVIKSRELWKKYLPAGSSVAWDVEIVGPPIVANLLADKSHIGYMGDMPALVATTKRNLADIRIVEANILSNTGQICSVMMTGADAPKFKDTAEALKWLDGKKIGISGKGSCGDRFVTSLIKKTGIKVQVEYLAPTIIKTSLQAKKLDAAQAFQPHVAQIENLGHGRVAFTGSQWMAQDANFILMRKDFIDNHPEAALGWIKADIEALQFILQNPYETVKIVANDLPGFSTKDLWMALYGSYAANTGSKETNVTVQAGFDKSVMDFIDDGFKFLQSVGLTKDDKPLPGAIYTDLVDRALKEMNLKAPLGTIKGLPASAFKG
jgi:NitT/TauT family transport system substrate-binding protein